MPDRVGQPWYNRAWMGLANAALPGNPFNTHQSGSVGNAWASGDYQRARAGDPYARARIALGVLPGLLGSAGEYGVTAAQNRAIHGYESSPDFVGPPSQDMVGKPVHMPKIKGDQFYTYDNPIDMGPPSELANNYQQPLPRFTNNSQGTGGGLGYGWGTVNPNDAVGMNLLMGSLGFAGITGGLGPDANAHLRPLVK